MYPHTRVPDSKTVEGHGTEAMAPSKRQKQAVVTTQRSKDSRHHGESILIFQSIEEIRHLKGVDAELPNNQTPRFEVGVVF